MCQCVWVWQTAAGACELTGGTERTKMMVYFNNDTVKLGGSVAEWLAYWTQPQKGPGSNRSRDAVG